MLNNTSHNYILKHVNFFFGNFFNALKSTTHEKLFALSPPCSLQNILFVEFSVRFSFHFAWLLRMLLLIFVCACRVYKCHLFVICVRVWGIRFFVCSLFFYPKTLFTLNFGVCFGWHSCTWSLIFCVYTDNVKKSISQCFVVYVPSSTEKWHGLPRRFIIITWTENKIYASEIFSKVINHFGSLFQTRFAGIHHFDVSLFTFRCWRAYGIEHFPHEVHSATSTFAKNSPKRKQFTLCHQKMHSARKKLLILIKNKNEIFMETLICVDCRLTMNRYKI